MERDVSMSGMKLIAILLRKFIRRELKIVAYCYPYTQTMYIYIYKYTLEGCRCYACSDTWMCFHLNVIWSNEKYPIVRVKRKVGHADKI